MSSKNGFTADDISKMMDFKNSGKLKLSPEQQQSLQKINTFIDSVNTKVGSLCDAECMREREREQLWTKYEKAKQTLDTAPNDLERARKDYFVFTKGSAWYESEERKKANERAEKMAKEIKSKFMEINGDISARLDDYLTTVKYVDNVGTAIKENEKILQEKKTELDSTENNEDLAGRKLFYELSDTTWMSGVIQLLSTTTWILFGFAIVWYYLYMGHYTEFFESIRRAGLQLGLLIGFGLAIAYLPNLLFSLLTALFPQTFA